MSIHYQKARLLGRMFRQGDPDTAGGEYSGGYGGGYGSGWGGFSASDTVQFGTPSAPAFGPESVGQRGESNMAQAGARGLVGPGYSIEGMSNRELADLGFGALEGQNPNNPTQTVDQLNASANVNSILGQYAPIAMSALSPQLGLAMSLTNAGGKLARGAPMEDVALGFLPGIINGKINQATGGVYGNAAKLGGALNSLTGSPQMPNIGREIVSGITGRSSGGPLAPSTPAAPSTAETSSDGATAAAQPATPAPAAQPAPQPDVNFASLGIESAGWTRAGKNYLEKRNGLV